MMVGVWDVLDVDQDWVERFTKKRCIEPSPLPKQ
jgi:hypothetical protein